MFIIIITVSLCKYTLSSMLNWINKNTNQSKLISYSSPPTFFSDGIFITNMDAFNEEALAAEVTNELHGSSMFITLD